MADVLQRGRINFAGDCVATMIDRLTCPTSCVIETAGDSSWCVTCGHRFDTNTVDGNLPPDCRLKIDPFRGGILT